MTGEVDPRAVREGPHDLVEGHTADTVELLDPDTGELREGHILRLGPGRQFHRTVDSVENTWSNGLAEALSAREDGSPPNCAVKGRTMFWHCAGRCIAPFEVINTERQKVADRRQGSPESRRVVTLRLRCGQCDDCKRDYRRRAVQAALNEVNAMQTLRLEPGLPAAVPGEEASPFELGTRVWFGTLTVNPPEWGRMCREADTLLVAARDDAAALVAAMSARLEALPANSRQRKRALQAAPEDLRRAAHEFQAWIGRVYRSRGLLVPGEPVTRMAQQREHAGYVKRAFGYAVAAFTRRLARTSDGRWRGVQLCWSHEHHKSGVSHGHVFVVEQGEPITKRDLERAWTVDLSGSRGGTAEEIAARRVMRGFVKMSLVQGDPAKGAGYVVKYATKEGGLLRRTHGFGQPVAETRRHKQAGALARTRVLVRARKFRREEAARSRGRGRAQSSGATAQPPPVPVASEPGSNPGIGSSIAVGPLEGPTRNPRRIVSELDVRAVAPRDPALPLAPPSVPRTG